MRIDETPHFPRGCEQHKLVFCLKTYVYLLQTDTCMFWSLIFPNPSLAGLARDCMNVTDLFGDSNSGNKNKFIFIVYKIVKNFIKELIYHNILYWLQRLGAITSKQQVTVTQQIILVPNGL